MSKSILFIYFILLTLTYGYGQGDPVIRLKEMNQFHKLEEGKVQYLITPKNESLSTVLNQEFQTSPSAYPELYSRDEKAIWFKFTCVSQDNDIYVFDFFRKDEVDLFIVDSNRVLNHFKTGYMRKSSEKQMGKWNSIRVDMEAGQPQTFYVKTVNDVNENDLILNVCHIKDWRNGMLTDLIIDIGFLAVLLIIAAHSILVYVQSRLKAYLNFGLYLITVFVFFAYISEVMRDYAIPEYPKLTLYAVSSALLIPYFYYGFVKEFLNMHELVPKLDHIFRQLVIVDLGIFAVCTAYYAYSKDYYFFSDIVRYILLINVVFCLGIVVIIWNKRAPLVKYFVLGSVAMLVASLLDLIVWRNYNSRLGEYAKVGFILEILFFSIGLGKKTKLIEEDKIKVQKSYINQLEINEELVEGQKMRLTKMVRERTSELQKAKEKAERHAKAKEEFLSVMSHEIRTPLNAIVGLTHLISDEPSREEREKSLETMRYSVDNLTRLINDILDYRKIDSGMVELERIPYNLKKTLREIVYLYEPQANNKDLNLHFQYDDSISELIYGDPHRLSQIISNLLSNAIKFTNVGDVTLALSRLSTEGEYDNIRFKVIDTGIGISDLDKKRVFNEFKQASDSTTRKYGGTGLGLSISKNLVHLMGGNIEIESILGKGTTFYFDLKCRHCIDTSADNQPPAVCDIPQGGIEGLNCLIVDDNKLNRIVLSKFLKNWNVESENVESGVEALKCLDNQIFDMLLLDLQMPDMDGYEVARKVRSTPKLANLPIIAITADSVSNIEEKVKEVGMNAFVTKPFNPDELKAKIYQYAMASVKY